MILVKDHFNHLLRHNWQISSCCGLCQCLIFVIIASSKNYVNITKGIGIFPQCRVHITVNCCSNRNTGEPRLTTTPVLWPLRFCDHPHDSQTLCLLIPCILVPLPPPQYSYLRLLQRASRSLFTPEMRPSMVLHFFAEPACPRTNLCYVIQQHVQLGTFVCLQLSVIQTFRHDSVVHF